MAIDYKQARQIAEKMIKESGRNLLITFFESVDYIGGDGLYIFAVRDKDTGEDYYPGELFKSIRKSDGKLIDFSLLPPTF